MKIFKSIKRHEKLIICYFQKSTTVCHKSSTLLTSTFTSSISSWTNQSKLVHIIEITNKITLLAN